MSAPAMNDFSPAPVMITTRIAPSCFSSRIARRSSSVVGVSRALRTAGRLTVRIATAPSRSSSRLSKATAGENYTPRPTAKQADRRADRVGIPVGNVSRPARHEALMQFIRDPVERRESKTNQHLSQRDARRKPTSQRSRDHEPESKVAKCVGGFVRYACRQRRLLQRGEVEDHGHVDQDRTPMREKGAVLQLQREEVQDPAERDPANDECPEQLRTEAELLLRLVAHQRREDDRHEQREQNHQADMGRHLRPCVISNASSTTSMFSRPETMRNALPYS